MGDLSQPPSLLSRHHSGDISKRGGVGDSVAPNDGVSLVGGDDAVVRYKAVPKNFDLGCAPLMPGIFLPVIKMPE